MAKPIINIIGGKRRLAPWISEQIGRFSFEVYTEPFCGSAAVFFYLQSQGFFERGNRKNGLPRIVLNDRDSNIVNLFRVCRDLPEHLARAIALTPYSREEHALCKDFGSLELGDIDRARKYAIACTQSFKGDPRQSWRIAKNGGDRPKDHLVHEWETLPERILKASTVLRRSPIDSPAFLNEAGRQFFRAISASSTEKARRYLTCANQGFTGTIGDSGWSASTGVSHPSSDKPQQWDSLSSKLLETAKSFKGCYIENGDFEEVLKRWDSPVALHYCDPPYFGKERYYGGGNFTMEDHERLASCLHQLKGAIVLSYYPDPEILRFYSEKDWEIHYKTVTVSTGNAGGSSKVERRPRKQEVLLVRKRESGVKQLSLF